MGGFSSVTPATDVAPSAAVLRARTCVSASLVTLQRVLETLAPPGACEGSLSSALLQTHVHGFHPTCEPGMKIRPDVCAMKSG